jgi:PQQ-dependent dehydrogenase (methanol/ethanol family)
MNKNRISRSLRWSVALLVLGVCALWLYPSLLLATAPQNLNWRNYGNDLANTRFQDVDQINTKNAHRLKPAWVFHTRVLDPKAELQASPIVIDGTMFVTDGHDDLFALDAANGHQKWAYKPLSTGDMPPLDQLTVCCGRNNKGVAFGEGKVFYGRLDDVVVALNANTGKVVWKKTLADFKASYAINNAPQFVPDALGPGKSLVIISVSGGEYEIRGRVFALRASDGETMWQFATTDPASYDGDQALKGGAAVWNPPAIDTELGLIYIVTGNAAPDILGEDRPGDNLFATSVVALSLKTGEPRWHFQAVHHDIWDYDSAQPPVLFPVGKQAALGHCSKNGQYYILERSTGAPIFAVTEEPAPADTTGFQHAAATQPHSAVEPLTPLTFVRPNDTGFPAMPQYTPPGVKDAKGNPIEFAMVPGDDGGCEWNPAGYSPRTKFIYYGTRYEPDTFKTFEGNRTPLPNGLHLGSTFTNRVPGSHPFGIFGATDTTTGKVVWKMEVPIPAKSGVAIGGDVLFFAEGQGKFHAVDAANGTVLFTFDPRSSHIRNVGGGQASPSVYVANGREFVAYMFGGNVPDRNNFANLDGQNPDAGKLGDALIAFAIPGKGEGEAEDEDE